MFFGRARTFTFLFLLLNLFCSLAFSSEDSFKEAFLKKYYSAKSKHWAKTCEGQTLTRSIASADPNDKKTSKEIDFSKFKSFVRKSKQNELKTVDLNKDGKPECTREFYVGEYIKKEKCDYDHNGVIDQELGYNEDGSLKYDYVNLDSDRFFESKVNCKPVKTEPGLILCKKMVDNTGDNKLNESFYFHKSSARKYLSSKFGKKQSRGIASSSEFRFDEDKILDPYIGYGYEKTLEKEVKSYFSIQKNLSKRKLDAWKKETRSFMKYFMSFESYTPGKFDGCLERGRNACQKDVDFKKMGYKGSPEDFVHCMNFTYYECSDNRDKSEGGFTPCFDCFTDSEYQYIAGYTKYLKEKADIEPYKSNLEGFTEAAGTEILFHKSCDPYFKEGYDKLNIFEYTDCVHNESMEFPEDYEPTEDDPWKTVRARHQGMRILRAMSSKRLDHFTELYGSSSHKRPTGVPDTWKTEKKLLDQHCKEMGRYCKDILLEEDARIKVFCDAKLGRTAETTVLGSSNVMVHQGVVMKPPGIYLDPKAMADGNGYKFKNPKEFVETEFAHALAHVMDHTHGYPKQIQKGPNKGKWRCDWSPEPDYAYLCEQAFCEKKRLTPFKCGAEPGDHINPETGDYWGGYSVSLWEAGPERMWNLKDSFEECQSQ